MDALEGRSAGATRKLIRHVTDRPGHDRRYAIDPSKIRRELGWSARHVFEHSLPALVSWYRDHKDWADDIRSGQYLSYYERQYGQRV